MHPCSNVVHSPESGKRMSSEGHNEKRCDHVYQPPSPAGGGPTYERSYAKSDSDTSRRQNQDPITMHLYPVGDEKRKQHNGASQRQRNKILTTTDEQHASYH